MDRFIILSPLVETKTSCLFDVDIHVHGGGPSGQAQAARRALAWALVNCDRSYFDVLETKGYLEPDSRQREPKKYGKHRARKSHTYKRR